METESNTQILQSLVEVVEGFDPWGMPDGLMARQIAEEGFYEEEGLRFVPEGASVGKLYAGLAVLARDMHLYLAQHPREDAALFEEVVSLVHEEESRAHGSQAFPTYDGLPVDDLPRHLASAADLGQPNLDPLGERGIVHEWTFKPGKRLFVKFGSKFKEVICGRDGPYEQFNKGLLKQAELPAAIAAAVLAAGFSTATFWTPLAVYVSILLIKTGLKTYCEPDGTRRKSRRKSTQAKRTSDRGP